jgi:hypothetical protein
MTVFGSDAVPLPSLYEAVADHPDVDVFVIGQDKCRHLNHELDLSGRCSPPWRPGGWRAWASTCAGGAEHPDLCVIADPGKGSRGRTDRRFSCTSMPFEPSRSVTVTLRC